MNKEEKHKREVEKMHAEDVQRIKELMECLIESDPRMSEAKEFKLNISHLIGPNDNPKIILHARDLNKPYKVKYERGDDFITVEPLAYFKPFNKISTELNELIAKINEMDDIKEYTHDKTRIIKDIDDNHIFTITIE